MRRARAGSSLRSGGSGECCSFLHPFTHTLSLGLSQAIRAGSLWLLFLPLGFLLLVSRRRFAFDRVRFRVVRWRSAPSPHDSLSPSLFPASTHWGALADCRVSYQAAFLPLLKLRCRVRQDSDRASFQGSSTGRGLKGCSRVVSSRPSYPNGKHQSFLPSPAEGFDLTDSMSVGCGGDILWARGRAAHDKHTGRDQQY